MTHMIRYTAAAIAGSLSLFVTQTPTPTAAAQPPVETAPPAADSLQPVQAAPEAAPAPSQTRPERVQSQTPAVSQNAPLECPPGQFASAFPDVVPTDWAYEAVNRLASVPLRCFPLPPR